MRSPKRILIQRCDRLGDTVLILPVIAALREMFPNAELHALTSPIGTEFLHNHPNITKIHTYTHSSGLRALWHLATQLRKEKYDVYISIWNNPDMAWVGFLAGIPIRIGDASNPTLKFLYTHPVHQQFGNLSQHWSQFNLSLLGPFKKIFIDPPLPVPIGVFTDPDCDRVVTTQAQDSASDKSIVLFFVGTGGSNFAIPEAAILRAIALIGKTGQYHLVLCGQNASETIMVLNRPYLTNLIGATNLGTLMSWIRLAKVYIGPDTGPTQIASMMGKPIILFSSMKSSPPGYWGPLGPAFRIIREEYNCPRFCHTDGCLSSCFDFVTGERLYTEFCDLLAQIEAGELWDPATTAEMRFKHTVRILIIATTATEWQMAESAKLALAKKDMKVWCVFIKKPKLKDAFSLISLIKRYNIGLVYAPFLPKIIWIAVRMILGIWYAYPSPALVPSGLIPESSVSDILKTYKTVWK